MVRRWPSWAIGLALFALVLFILAGAFYLNAQLKPKVGSEPVPTAPVPTPIPTRAGSPPAAAGAFATATVNPSAEKAVVVAAYLHYWDVYSDALLTLDSSHLADVADGDELKRAQGYVGQLKAGNQALKIDVNHQYEVSSVTTDTATLEDQIVNRSYLIDSSTKRPLGSPESATPETISCRFQLENGVWKVTSVIKVAVTVVNQ
jgi:hypothetical protein